MITLIQEKLSPIIELLKSDKIAEAEQAFSALGIVDTPEHLAQSKAVRQLIWELYEYLVVANYHYITKEEIIENFNYI